jgi:hypothetical protein
MIDDLRAGFGLRLWKQDEIALMRSKRARMIVKVD